jgi:predicted DNA binding CopG/RHH family protein
MDEKPKIPDFASEDEEARWWFDNQESLDEQFIKAAAEGRLGRGTVARRAAIPTTTIRLDPEDISKARVLAERRGLKYQTYLKMLIHEALQKESERLTA